MDFGINLKNENYEEYHKYNFFKKNVKTYHKQNF